MLQQLGKVASGPGSDRTRDIIFVGFSGHLARQPLRLCHARNVNGSSRNFIHVQIKPHLSLNGSPTPSANYANDANKILPAREQPGNESAPAAIANGMTVNSRVAGCMKYRIYRHYFCNCRRLFPAQ